MDKIILKRVGKQAYETTHGPHDFHIRKEGDQWIVDRFLASEPNKDKAYIDSEEVATLKQARQHIEEFAASKPEESKAIVVWGLPKGETERYKEVLLAETCRTQKDIEKVKAAAAKDGWHSFRVATVDLTEPPDFAATVRKR